MHCTKACQNSVSLFALDKTLSRKETVACYHPSLWVLTVFSHVLRVVWREDSDSYAVERGKSGQYRLSVRTQNSRGGNCWVGL